MKKFSLFVVLIISAFCLQYCTKASESAVNNNTPTPTIQAFINDTTWIPTSYSVNVTYTAATKTKVFTLTGIQNTQQLNIAITQKNASSVGNGFPAATFTVDTSSSRVLMSYAKLSTGTTFVPQGTVRSGYMTISAVDSVNMKITGTFNFNTIKYAYDSKGNVTNFYVNQINEGQVNTIKYNYIKK